MKRHQMHHARYIAPMAIITFVVFLTQLFALWVGGESVLFTIYHFDKIQHFLGGSACGIFGVWCLTHLRKVTGADFGPHYPIPTLLKSAFISALMIGGLWEVYEHGYPDKGGAMHSYWSLETQLDLLCDVVGGCVASLFYRRVT